MSEDKIGKVEIKNFGPIRDVKVELWDLNVIVGPQASGKSLFLQILKLYQDAGEIKENLNKHNYNISNITKNEFADVYFGNNMRNAFSSKTGMKFGGKSVSFDQIIKKKNMGRINNFFIPAHRGMILADGYINNFWGKLDFPYIVKEFTDKTREILKSSDDIFPNSGKLITELRELIDQYIYRGSLLKKKKGIIDSLSLTPKGMKPEEGLPIPVWSAGQREFFPLLVGLYHLLPSGGISRKDFIQTVIIEEPEMGLHPSAVVAVMLVILSLLYRNYQVILSTHSPVLLDVIWGIRKLREFGGTYKDFKEMFDLHNDRFKHIYGTLSDKKFQMKTYLFHPDEDGTAAKDISELEPGSEDEIIAKWGGLTDFTDRITQTVMKMGFRS